MDRGGPRRPGPAKGGWRSSSGPPGVGRSGFGREIDAGRVVFGGEMPVVGCVTGEGEEDLVEGGTADADVVDREAGVGEAGERRGERGGTVGGGKGDPLTGSVDEQASMCQRVERVDGRVDVAGVADAQLDHVAAEFGFELIGRAGGDDAASVDDDDTVREAV